MVSKSAFFKWEHCFKHFQAIKKSVYNSLKPNYHSQQQFQILTLINNMRVKNTWISSPITK